MSSELRNPESGEAAKQQKLGNGRKVLLILGVIFLLPFTVAATLHLLQVHPGGHSYGDLIKPPKALHFPVLQDATGKPFTAEQWSKKWSIVTIGAADCNDACHKQRYLLQQVHISLGKEIDRVQRVLLIPVEMDKNALLGLQKKYPNLVILSGSDAQTVTFANTFDLSGKAKEGAEDVYLVDPLGNLMMRYVQGAGLKPKGLRQDITRLLKNSWAG